MLLLEYRLESLVDLERADGNIEFSRIKVADASVKIARASNYVKVNKYLENISVCVRACVLGHCDSRCAED